MAAQQRKPPAPIDLVVLTRARLQEVVDEAVRRGRITRSDATDLVSELVARGRSGADGVLSGPLEMARRVAGSQPAITGYDDLTAAEIADRLDGLDLAPAATDPRLRAREREPQDRPRGRSSARLSLIASPSERDHAPTSTRPARGAELELTIDSLAHGGNGVARLDGYVVFVAGALPGDRVRAVVGKSKRAYAEARAVEVLEPSPDRIAAVADHPGAPWQVLPTSASSRSRPSRSTTRCAGSASSTASSWSRSSPRSSSGATATSSSTRSAPARTASSCAASTRPGAGTRSSPIDDCLLASERGNAAREQVLAWCRAQGLGAWDRRTQRGLLRNLVVREGRRTGELQVRLVTSPGELDADSLTAAVDADGCCGPRPPTSARAPRAARRRCSTGASSCDEQLGDLDFLISPEAFFQTNTEMAEVLYGVAIEYADLRGHERVFDLYCGIGTIGLTLASRAPARSSASRSSSPRSPTRSRTRASTRSTNARFYAGDVRARAARPRRGGRQPDVAVVDPPRAGPSQKVVRRIVEAAPKRIVYVSCNPTTLAPNAAQLVEAGYELQRVRPVDMFPQTPHIECVALFEAGPDGVANPDR